MAHAAVGALAPPTRPTTSPCGTRMRRLPSALGPSGAKRGGGLVWTLDPPKRSDSPIALPPSPSDPCTRS
eukprot:scaffold1666_cov112-Isochrysis_galbana.AAC.2